jgi:hypothetical protein
MVMSSRLRFKSFIAVVALLGLVSLPGHPTAAAPLADVTGNTYTSPTYGYTVTWDDSWYLVEETSEDGIDFLTIADGVAFVQFLSVSGYFGDLEMGLAAVIVGTGQNSSVSNYRPLTDEDDQPIRGGDESRAFAVYAATTTLEDGSSVDLAIYLEFRTIVPDEVGLAIAAPMPIEAYDFELPRIEQLLTGISVPGISESDESENAVSGEPAPVFASGPWRVAIATAVIGEAIPEADLQVRGDTEWLLVVADITNWSDADATFDAREFQVGLADAEAGADLSVPATRSVAQRLDLKPGGRAPTVDLDAGETARVVLVYRIPAGGDGLTLVREESALPLEEVLAVSFDPDALPPAAVPAEVVEATVSSVERGNQVRIQEAGGGPPRRVRLLGVELPTGDACYAEETTARLADLEGATVFLEEEPAVTTGSTPVLYLWVAQDDGTRALLNQQLLAEGMAEVDPLPSEARFGAWLAGTEQTAQTEQTGLWSGCGGDADADPETEEAEEPGDTAATVLDGRWEGEIETGGSITFVVKDGGIASVEFVYDCPEAGTAMRSKNSFSPPVRIEDGAFTADHEIPNVKVWTVSGNFISATEAEGSLTVEEEEFGCDAELKWTATNT